MSDFQIADCGLWFKRLCKEDLAKFLYAILPHRNVILKRGRPAIGSAGSGFLHPVRSGDAFLFKSIDQFSPHGGVDPASQQALIPGLEVIKGIPVDRDDRDAYDNKCCHTLL